MVKDAYGDIFGSGAEALVNPVNCVGVMGAGLALKFKERWPENYKAYAAKCRGGRLKPGRVLVYTTGLPHPPHPKYIINIPTKNHWRDSSRLKYVSLGLDGLVKAVSALGIRSVALPALGCGLGGLDWETVRALTIKKLSALPETDVFLYAPGGPGRGAQREYVRRAGCRDYGGR